MGIPVPKVVFRLGFSLGQSLSFALQSAPDPRRSRLRVRKHPGTRGWFPRLARRGDPPRYTWEYHITSSTAQGGGGSFKNRKPIGEVGCCESGMVERSHSWIERWLISLTILSFSDYLPTYLPIYLSTYLSIYRSIYLSLSLSPSSV